MKRVKGKRRCNKCRKLRRWPDGFAVTKSGAPSQSCHACAQKERRCKRCERMCRVPREIRPLGRLCFACKKELQHEHDRAYYRLHREQVIARANAWNKAHPERHKGYIAAHFERVKADPERYAAYLARQRMRQRIKGHIKIDPDRKPDRRTIGGYSPPTIGSHTAPMVDAGPLADWLIREFGSWPTTELGRYLGVDDSHLQKLMERQGKVSLHVADRICVGADCTHMLALLYPLETAA